MTCAATLHRMGCNFTQPFDHSPPVNHGGAQIHLYEWPDECVWAQLQYERWQQDSHPNHPNTTYLANLEKEWARRGICSRCHRDVDPSVDQQVSELEARAQNAEDKLGRIRRLITVTPDTALRPEIMSILDEQ
jgi:hypothetical protein